ncbi:hypothetical protein LguiA_012382 [Lonicera macranthoides]
MNSYIGSGAVEIYMILYRAPKAPTDLESVRAPPPAAANGDPAVEKVPLVKKRKDTDVEAVMKSSNAPSRVNGKAELPVLPPPVASRRAVRSEDVVDEDEGFGSRQSHMKYELRESPGLVPIGLYGFQHYLSMLGLLILIPLVIVPAMSGDHEDTSIVVSTVLFVSGITTLLHTSMGSRLPLIQGPSFVYLAPALAIINSLEFLGLNGNNFKHIMKELQGAIIITLAFQIILGYSGLMALFLSLLLLYAKELNANSGVDSLLALDLKKMLFHVVPLGLTITWAAAFLLTEAGAYSYKGCDANMLASNIISEHCRNHVSKMKYCRVDTSHALCSSPWFRFPYPLQWGTPIFSWKMALVMCVVSIITSVDSVGSYHASSLLVASRPPTPGVVSRAIGLEGLCSILADLWGTGTGSTTLTENVHTIAVTKMGSRRAIEFGVGVLIVLSLVGPELGQVSANFMFGWIRVWFCIRSTLFCLFAFEQWSHVGISSSKDM